MSTRATNEVVLVEYDSSWPARFEAIRADIQGACGDLIVCVEHLDSTAIPGMAAKPIIDAQPGLRTFGDGFACVEPMERLGYVSRGEGHAWPPLLRSRPRGRITRACTYAGGRLGALVRDAAVPGLPHRAPSGSA